MTSQGDLRHTHGQFDDEEPAPFPRPSAPVRPEKTLVTAPADPEPLRFREAG